MRVTIIVLFCSVMIGLAAFLPAQSIGPPAPPMMLPLAQVAPTIITQRIASWGKSGGAIWIDVDGNPEVISSLEIVAANLGEDLNAGGTAIESEVYPYLGVDSQDITVLLDRLPSQGPYTLWMRVVDQANIPSAYVQGNDFIYDTAVPAAAVNLILR